jgi:hypothetical protein
MLNYCLLTSILTLCSVFCVMSLSVTATGPAETMVKVDLVNSGKFKIYSRK